MQQAMTYLWGGPPSKSDALRPDPTDPETGGRHRRYLINKSDMDLVLSLRHGLASIYLERIRIITSNAPVQLPSWVPSDIRQAILDGKVPAGVTRFPGTAPWGSIVAWIDRTGRWVSIQVYQEFPESFDYYLNATEGNSSEARLLQKVYIQFNRDMRFFVEERKLSPELARAEILTINNELFKLVIEAAVEVLTSGAAISAVNNSIRASSREVIEAAERTGFEHSSSSRTRPKNGRINVGGGLEPGSETASNLNPIKPGSGGPSKGIQNLVKATFEEIGDAFEAGSAEYVFSNRLRFNDVLDWRKAADGTARVMRPGGKLSLNVWATAEEAKKAAQAFRDAGFKAVEIIGEGTSTIIEGIR
jgi:hypothetical protein